MDRGWWNFSDKQWLMEICTSSPTGYECNKEPFGGVNIVAIGDLFQLQHVKGQFISMDLKYNYGPLAINLGCEYFTIYELHEIMHKRMTGNLQNH